MLNNYIVTFTNAESVVYNHNCMSTSKRDAVLSATYYVANNSKLMDKGFIVISCKKEEPEDILHIECTEDDE